MNLFSNRFVGIACLVIAGQAVLFYSASHGENTPLPAPLKTFPTHVGSFSSLRDVPIDQETQDILKADDLMERIYAGPDGAADFYVAYFKTQRTGQSPHSPKNCLPGSGWEQEVNGRLDLTVADRVINVNRYIVSKGDEKSLVLYWYQSQGRVIADEFAAKFYLITDSIRKHRSDTALVRIVVGLRPGQEQEADATATGFLKASFPLLETWLPK